MRFYICKHCGNIIAYVENEGVPVMCCGEQMQEIIPGSVEASEEKHLPVITVEDDTVTVFVGNVTHPMTKDHYIKWIVLETKEGNQRKKLHPDELPKAVFKITDGDGVISAYSYCNLHGLWKS